MGGEDIDEVLERLRDVLIATATSDERPPAYAEGVKDALEAVQLLLLPRRTAPGQPTSSQGLLDRNERWVAALAVSLVDRGATGPEQLRAVVDVARGDEAVLQRAIGLARELEELPDEARAAVVSLLTRARARAAGV